MHLGQQIPSDGLHRRRLSNPTPQAYALSQLIIQLSNKHIICPSHPQEHWIAPGGGAGSGCVVVMEGGGDLPASTSGRLSFKGFKTGPKTAYQGGAAAIEEHEDIATGEADVGDEAMAER